MTGILGGSPDRAPVSLAAWTVALALVWATLTLVAFEPRDGDGWLYTHLAEELAHRDFGELLVVKWYGLCKIYPPTSAESRFFYEHPPGLFLLPVALAKLGLPPTKVTLFADTIYQILALAALAHLVGRYRRTDRTRVALAALAMPISCLYSLRATHETPLLMCLFACLALVPRMHERPISSSLSLLMVTGFAALVKGLMALPLVLICMTAAAVLSPPKRRLALALLVSTAMLAGGYVALTAFELLHMARSGLSFWRQYLDIQLWHRALDGALPWWAVFGRTLSHLAFYMSCLTWFAAPWTVAWGIQALRTWRRSRRFTGLAAEPDTLKLTLILILGVAFYLGSMSLFARVSMRYVHPAYFLLGVAGFLNVRGFRPQWMTVPRAAGLWCLSRCAVILLN